MKNRLSWLMELMCGAVAALAVCGIVGATEKNSSVPASRESSLRCRDNLKRLSLVVFLYANDHSEVMPTRQDLVEFARSYTTTPALPRCPDGADYDVYLAATPNPMFVKRKFSVHLGEIPMLYCSFHGQAVMADGHWVDLAELYKAENEAERECRRCAANLKVTGAFVRMYLDEHRVMLSADDLTGGKYVAPRTGVFVCPQGGQYEFVAPRGTEIPTTEVVLILRCPRHGNVLTSDGNVHNQKEGEKR